MSKLKAFRAALDLHDPEAEQRAEQLAQAARNLLNIPSLSFLSGHSKLFMVARLGEQEGWSRNPTPRTLMHYKMFCCNIHASVKVGCLDCLHEYLGYQEWIKMS